MTTLAAAPDWFMLPSFWKGPWRSMDERGAGAAETETTRLLRSCAEGDQAAFRRLYELQSPRLYGLALRLLPPPALAAR